MAFLTITSWMYAMVKPFMQCYGFFRALYAMDPKATSPVQSGLLSSPITVISRLAVVPSELTTITVTSLVCTKSSLELKSPPGGSFKTNT